MNIEILNAGRPLVYSTFTGPKGEKGDTGAKVIDVKYVKTLEDGSYLYEQVLDDGSKFEFISPIGPKGDKGDIGPKGDQGIQGPIGETGTGIVDIDEIESPDDGGVNTISITLSDKTVQTITVKNGHKGSQGEAGHTPVKGVDYWTPADQEQMVQEVIEALPDGDTLEV